MKTILCYGDSNTFGYDAAHDSRFAPDIRWPGVVQKKLGSEWRVIEEGLNHRTTALDDPDNPGRNGATYLLPCLLSHRPLDLVIIMLGINDMKARFNRTPEQISADLGGLIALVRASACGINAASPAILLLALPLPGTQNDFATMYAGVEEKARRLPHLYRTLARETGCGFMDGSSIRCPYPDGIHLGAAEHRILGERVAAFIPSWESCGFAASHCEARTDQDGERR